MKNPLLVGFVVASALLPIFSPNFRADEQQNTEAEIKTYSFVATVKEKHTPQLLVGFSIIGEE